MLYRFAILSDEVDNFAREITIDASATFLDFHHSILESVGYTDDQPTFFYLCDGDSWQRGTVVSLFDTETASDEDSYLMENTELRELIDDEGQRLIYVFNYIDGENDGLFYIQLKQIEAAKHLEKAECTLKKGNPPAQMILDEDVMPVAGNKVAGGSSILDDEDSFFGSDDFNDDELEEEGLNTDTIDPDSIY